MKVSLDLQHDDLSNSSPLLKAKLPISIFNHPFISIFTTPAHSFSDLSVALSTNFSSGPSLRFTYSPSTASPSNPFSPFSLSLKSGLGLFGSPRDSPLVFSANFSLSNSTPNSIIPTFSLHFKPQLGHFSLHKTSSNPHLNSNFETQCVSGLQMDSPTSSDFESGNGFWPDGPLGWQEVKLEPFIGKQKEGFSNGNPSNNGGIDFLSDRQLVWLGRKKEGFLSGAAVKARTELPLSKRVKLNLRWVLNLPGNSKTKMPSLTVNKIAVERIEEVKEAKGKSNEEAAEADLELMKGMCFWMRRDLQIMEKENRDLKQCLEEMRQGVLSAYSPGAVNGGGKNVMPASTDRFVEFEHRRSKTSGEGNRDTELKKPANPMSDLESELQRAIKAAAS